MADNEAVQVLGMILLASTERIRAVTVKSFVSDLEDGLSIVSHDVTKP